MTKQGFYLHLASRDIIYDPANNNVQNTDIYWPTSMIAPNETTCTILSRQRYWDIRSLSNFSLVWNGM